MWRNSKQSFTPHGHTNRRVATTRRRVNCLLATDRQKAKMRAKTSWLLSATWLLGATAASAQSFPCASVAPEVRDRVREAGACRDAAPDDAATKGAAAASSAVTLSLSDGTVVRVPREISANIRDSRKRAETNEPAARARVSSRSAPDASSDSAPALRKLEVVTAPATAAAASSTPAPATDSTAASAAAPVPASEATVPPEPRGRFQIAFSTNAALILGAGVLLVLLFGALLMRQWLLRRELAADVNAAPTMLSQHPQPVETSAGGLSETSAAPEIRFAARLDPGESTIVFATLPDGDEVAIAQSSDHHA